MFMRDFKAVPPDQQDLILEVKSELVANTDVNALAERMKSSIPGLVVNEVVNLPDYKAIIVQGTTNGNSLGLFAQRFVDSNPLDSEVCRRESNNLRPYYTTHRYRNSD